MLLVAEGIACPGESWSRWLGFGGCLSSRGYAESVGERSIHELPFVSRTSYTSFPELRASYDLYSFLINEYKVIGTIKKI